MEQDSFDLVPSGSGQTLEAWLKEDGLDPPASLKGSALRRWAIIELFKQGRFDTVPRYILGLSGPDGETEEMWREIVEEATSIISTGGNFEETVDLLMEQARELRRQKKKLNLLGSPPYSGPLGAA